MRRSDPTHEGSSRADRFNCTCKYGGGGPADPVESTYDCGRRGGSVDGAPILLSDLGSPLRRSN